MKKIMTIGCLAAFAAGTVFAGSDEARVTDCGGDVWRIQTTAAPGRFENRGAVQVFKDFLGEKHVDRASAPSRGLVTKTGRGDWRVTASLAEIQTFRKVDRRAAE